MFSFIVSPDKIEIFFIPLLYISSFVGFVINADLPCISKILSFSLNVGSDSKLYE